MGYVIASKLVGTERRPVRFLYREEPDDAKGDSGWRIFSGYEDQAYADDSKNFALYDANTIAEIDPSIIPLLQTPARCAFEREDPDGPFIKTKASDFNFEAK